jgi:hypothetical protein
MRFFASWWERFPKHEAAGVVAVVVGLGMAHHAPGFFRLLVGPAGFSWG